MATADACTANMCMNGATCVSNADGGAGYACTCAQGFSGPMCNDTEQDQDTVTTQASTTAQGSVLTRSIILTVTALGLAVIMNAVTLS